MGAARPPEPRAQAQAPANPFEEMMTSFLRAGFPQAAKAPEPDPEPAQQPAGPIEAWGRMMEGGQDMQRQYLASLQNIFETTWGRGSDRS